MTVKILLRRGTAAEWTSANTLLSAGEPGFETDTGQFKIGDGSTSWNSLPYATATDVAVNLEDLENVTISDPVNGQVLRFNGTAWINGTASTENTTYAVSAVEDTGTVKIRLTGSDSTTDDITIAATDDITVTRTSDSIITIGRTGVDQDTTYDISAVSDIGSAKLRLSSSEASTDDVSFVGGSGVSVSSTDANTITISSTVIPGITSVSEDTNPQLGGQLNINGNSVVSGTTVFIDGTNLAVNLNGTIKGDVVPATDVQYDLGSLTNRFRDLYLSGSTINLGGATISAAGSAITLPAGTTTGGVNIGTIILKGSVADDTALDALADPEVGDAYVVLSPSPTHLWTYDGVAFVDLGTFQGPQGDPGVDGIDGIDGTDGNSVLNGTVDPTTEGVDGDFYINTFTNTIFGPKATTWPAGVSLIGPAGNDGTDGVNGEDGRGIVTIDKTDGDGSEGTTDTYTITYTDDSTSTFEVYNGADGNPTALEDLTDVDTITLAPTDGQALVWNGTSSKWVPGTVSGGGGGTGLGARTTVSGTSLSLTDGATGPVNISNGFKSYALLKVQVDRAAWVRIYTSESARQADNSREEGTDPLPGAGVIAEVITTGAQTVLITPATIGFNDESPVTTEVPIRVTNKSGSTATIQVTLTVIQLEA
jgi:hypothetical protein